MKGVLRLEIYGLTDLLFFALKRLDALNKLHLVKLSLKQLLLKVHQVVIKFVDAVADDALVANRKQRLTNFLHRFRAFHGTSKPIQHFAPQQYVDSGNSLALLKGTREGAPR